jgi:hypothetical protein
MKTKFDEIVSRENLDLIIATIGQVEGTETQKTNLVETIINILGPHQAYFNTLSETSKLETLFVVTIIFDTLLDKEINPHTANLLRKAISAFNNNIFGRL